MDSTIASSAMSPTLGLEWLCFIAGVSVVAFLWYKVSVTALLAMTASVLACGRTKVDILTFFASHQLILKGELSRYDVYFALRGRRKVRLLQRSKSQSLEIPQNSMKAL